MDFNQFLTEDKAGKNLHLTHLEDALFEGGVSGARSSIQFLQSLRDMLAGHSPVTHLNMTTKFDGAPAIFCGINPDNGKFFVGTKGVFALNAKLNYTNEDIDTYYPGSGLNEKLKIALRYLPELGIAGVLQGDMMYTRSDLKTDTIDGVKYITFQPNTLVYAVPADSELAHKILSSQLGVVFHTTYTGQKLSDMKASFGVNIDRLKKTKNVWFRDASFIDAQGVATFTENETKEITAHLSEAGKIFRQIPAGLFNALAMTDSYRIPIMTWNNSKVRSGEGITDTNQHTKGLLVWYEAKLNKDIAALKKEDAKLRKTQEKNHIMSFFRNNKDNIKKIFDLQNHLVKGKTMVIKKLERIKQMNSFIKTDTGFKVSPAEGFVVTDRLSGNTLKLVDRMSFSFNNFNAVKNWSS